MKIYDPIYGALRIPEEFSGIIDSPQFRRLRHVKQLGLCYLSFPGANHSRFEHSIGAYHLASCLKGVLKSSVERKEITKFEAARLEQLFQLGALCHDIGHGPFSHMIENVLRGLGSKVTHEEIGSGILFFNMKDEIKSFSKWNIDHTDVSRILLHDSEDDPLIQCARDVISSDLDVDRIDYLFRDLYYTGISQVNGSNLSKQIGDVWKLRRSGSNLRLVLTEHGVRFAEEMLFLRRNNYQKIVYESRHIAATGMFEKVIEVAVDEGGEFGNLVKSLLKIKTEDLQLKEEYRKNYEKAMEIYSLVDFEALALLQKDSPNIRRLIQAIRHGEVFESIKRIAWKDLHPISIEYISKFKSDKEAYEMKRDVERKLSEATDIDVRLIVAHIPPLPSAKFATIGVDGDKILEDVSDMVRFLKDDLKRQYAIEVFVSKVVEKIKVDQMIEVFESMFKRGRI